MSELSERTESRRTRADSTLNAARRSSLGQFFTPERAATLIAGLPRIPTSGKFRILDPGAGAGSLSAAIVARILREAPALRIELVAVEIDPAVAKFLETTLSDCVETAGTQGVAIVTRLIVADYIDVATSLLANEPALKQPFDLVIMNPPYRKLPASSAHRKALTATGVECSNLYAAFLALGIQALNAGGQLVAITPRSFANGPYFRQFRHFFFDRAALDRIHIFQSRSSVFSDTGVLQENIVFSATRGGTPQHVVLSASVDHTDVPEVRIANYDEVIHRHDPDRVLRIVSGQSDAELTESMAGLPCTLATLGIQVSTGKVVDFRSRDRLRKDADAQCVPLVYPGNARSGKVEWPREIRKAQGFAVTDESSKKLLMPAGNYVLVKRFSSKEERRRVVAAVWTPDANGNSAVAFENHLNIFHIGGHGLKRDVALGLSLWLNSTIVDKFFRTFSGHTQVNATDLRSLRFPPLGDLQIIGRGQPTQLPDQTDIDARIHSVLMRTKVVA